MWDYYMYNESPYSNGSSLLRVSYKGHELNHDQLREHVCKYTHVRSDLVKIIGHDALRCPNPSNNSQPSSSYKLKESDFTKLSVIGMHVRSFI